MKNLLLLLCFWAKVLVAQNYLDDEKFIVRCNPQDTNCGIVIAISGLKIREQPNQQSKVLGIVPYGKKITRLVKNTNLAYPEFTKDSIIGNWEKIKYANIEGYAFNAFYAEGILKMEEKYTLLLEDYGWCWYDNYGSPFEKINYYIALLSKDSSETTIQQFTPTFSYYNGDIGGIKIDCSDKRESKFIIATKENLKIGKIKSASNKVQIISRGIYDKFKLFETTIPNSNWVFEFVEEKRLSEQDQSEYLAKVMFLKDTKTEKKQKISDNCQGSETIKLIWSGDIDGDGKTDFLLQFEGEEYDGYFQFFLTKGAENKEMIIPSSRYFLYDCC